MKKKYHVEYINTELRIYSPFKTDRETDRHAKVVSEHDQEIPQSQTTGKPMAPRGKATQQSRETKKTN